MGLRRTGLALALAAMGMAAVGCSSPGALSGKGYRSFAEYEQRDAPGPKSAPRVARVSVSRELPGYTVPTEPQPPRESRPYRSLAPSRSVSTAEKVFTVIGEIIGYAIVGAFWLALQIVFAGAGGAGGGG